MKILKKLVSIIFALLMVVGVVTLQKVPVQAKTQAIEVTNVKENKVTLNIRENLTLKTNYKLSQLKFHTSNKKIVTISNKGVISALKKGTAKITVSLKKNAKIRKIITVNVCEKDWYVKNKTLYINKINYYIGNIVGNNKYVYLRPWERYNGEIKKIDINAKMTLIDCPQTIEKGSNTDVTNYMGLFVSNHNIEFANVNIDMGEVKDASYFFANCSKLKCVTVNLSGTSVEDLSRMFSGDSCLEKATVNVVPKTVENCPDMFKDCKNLTDVSLSFSGKMHSCERMFEGCKSIQSVYIPFAINDTYCTAMFFGCSSLKSCHIAGVTLDQRRDTIFDKDNSISNYSFASSWNINTDNWICPIGHLYDFFPLLSYKGDIIVYVSYEKEVPEWYKRGVETWLDIEDYLHILQSTYEDIYISSSEDYSEFGWSDYADLIVDAVAEAEKEAGNDDLSEKKGYFDKIRNAIDLLGVNKES